MNTLEDKLKRSHKTAVSVVQAAPVLFDKDATICKALELLKECNQNGSELVLFPEAFIPAYPRGLSFGTVIGSRSDSGRETWLKYWENSIEVPGNETNRLGYAAKKNKTFMVIGVIERDERSKGTLYCTMLYFNKEGELIGKHRKLKPTGAERIIWGEGDKSTLTVLDTELGKLGGLICWENYMPMARMEMYKKGIELYLAPTADSRPTWQSTLIHIACEGRCFVLGCNQFVIKSMYPKDLPGIEDLENQPEIMCRGGSVIISPFGEAIAGPLWDKEGILHATLDMSQIIKGKMDFDPIGHYHRPDIFGE